MTNNSKTSYQGWGTDAYPAEEPQAMTDTDDSTGFMFYDKPEVELGTGDYNFFFGNGQLEVSKDHSHDELAEHTGVQANKPGPSALGKVEVEQGRAHWLVSGNIALKGLAKRLKEYTKQAGWRWGGLASLDGNPISDEFMPKKAMYYGEREGSLVLSHVPIPDCELGHIVIQGKTAKYYNDFPEFQEGIKEWASDFGYKLAEYPGGGDMNDRIKNHEEGGGEDLDMFDLGANSVREEDANPKGKEEGPYTYNGIKFNSYEDYLEYKKNLTKDLDTPVPGSGHFPEAPDMDLTLPNNFTDRQPFTYPVASIITTDSHEASRVSGYDLYSNLWQFDNPAHRHYVAYLDGKAVGYQVMGSDGAIIMAHIDEDYRRRGIFGQFLSYAQRDYGVVFSKAASEYGARAMQHYGFVEVTRGVYVLDKNWITKTAVQMPKDMIEASVPFIYDIDADTITLGHIGTQTGDIPGKFTPGGIVEGEYAPGGKVTISTNTNMPFTTRHLIDLWYWQHPQMEVTSVEMVDLDGKSTKLAGSARISSMDVGQYLKTLAMADPAVDRAYKALKDAGGKVYVVGGAVRDALLQKQPKDIDLMVQGLPSQVVSHVLGKLEGNVDLTGKSFGVYRYRTAGHEVEIALPRTEKSTGNKRTDFDFNIDENIPVEADLQRRDFTANAMAVSLDNGKLIDPFNGAKDIDDKKLQTVSPNSFKEDPTRLVRGLVAASRHGLIPTEELRGQMAENAHRLDLESPDRVGAEMDKLMRSDNPTGAIRLAKETGLLKHLVPELHNHFDYDQNNSHHNHSLGDHTLGVLEGVQKSSSDPDLRLAALFHDLGKPASAWRDPETGQSHYYRGPNDIGDNHEEVGAEIAGNRLDALRWPKRRTQRIQHLIANHMYPDFSSAKGARKFINKVGDEHADDLMTLRNADREGKGTSEWQGLDPVARQRALVNQVRQAGSATQQADLPITGKDIMEHLGISPGPAVGEALQRATDKVIEDPSFNNRNDLLNFLSDGPT